MKIFDSLAEYELKNVELITKEKKHSISVHF